MTKGNHTRKVRHQAPKAMKVSFAHSFEMLISLAVFDSKSHLVRAYCYIYYTDQSGILSLRRIKMSIQIHWWSVERAQWLLLASCGTDGIYKAVIYGKASNCTSTAAFVCVIV